MRNKLLQVTQRLSLAQAGKLIDDRPPEQRSPSPEPIYNEHGVRLNTREQRYKDKLLMQRTVSSGRLRAPASCVYTRIFSKVFRCKWASRMHAAQCTRPHACPHVLGERIHSLMIHEYMALKAHPLFVACDHALTRVLFCKPRDVIHVHVVSWCYVTGHHHGANKGQP